MRADAVRRSRLLAYDPTKIFLGVIDGAARTVAPSSARPQILGGKPIGFGDDTHAMTIAGNRSGKGRSSIIPTLLELCGIDARRRTSRASWQRSRRRVGPPTAMTCSIADPFDIVRGPARRFRARFNPLSILKPGSPTMIEDAGLIADALVVPGNTQDPALG